MKTMRAFIWGGAIGAVLGLLFAPQRGEVTREQLRERLTQFQGQAQQALGNLPPGVSNAIESGRQRLNTTISQAQQAANTVTGQARQTTNTAADKAQQMTNTATQQTSSPTH
jgi:gas vesicle protein